MYDDDCDDDNYNYDTFNDGPAPEPERFENGPFENGDGTYRLYP